MRMIVAVDQDNAIGWTSGYLPWRSSADLKNFKLLTTSGDNPAVIMGRKTWESIGHPLPGRWNYVMTRNDELASRLLEQGCFPIRGLANVASEKVNAWLIGGASLYDAALDQGLITELYVTLVHQRSNADVKLKHDLYNWKLFAIQELQQGRSWYLDEITVPTVKAEEPGITFIKLRRMI